MKFSFNDDVLKKVDGKVNIGDVIGPELNGLFDREVWQETIDMQTAFNDSVAPGWKDNPEKYDMWMAVLDETLEVLTSKHWKWWKDKDQLGQVDWDNIEVELTDLFLFLLGMVIQEGSEEVLYMTLASTEIQLRDNPDAVKVRDAAFFEDFWNHFLTAVSLKTLPLAVVKWVEFWFRTGADVNKIMLTFRVKAALNLIRQEFGYSTGKYQKMWNGVEDNVVAWELSKDLVVNKDTYTNMVKQLREYYIKEVAL